MEVRRLNLRRRTTAAGHLRRRISDPDHGPCGCRPSSSSPLPSPHWFVLCAGQAAPDELLLLLQVHDAWLLPPPLPTAGGHGEHILSSLPIWLIAILLSGGVDWHCAVQFSFNLNAPLGLFLLSCAFASPCPDSGLINSIACCLWTDC